MPPRKRRPSEIVASGFHRNGTGPNPSSFGATSNVMFTGGGAGGGVSGTTSPFTSRTSSVRGSFPRAIPWEEAKARFRAICPGGRFDSVDAGKKSVRTVAVVSGGGADECAQASAAGLDAFLTGEFGLQHRNAVLNAPIDLAAAGHYATERFGVRALGEALAAEFGIAWEFVDLNLPW